MARIALTPHRPASVDNRSLGIVGFAYVAITVLVVTIAAVVVEAHVDGRLSLDGANSRTAALSPSGAAR
jgi:hypothetical protein